METGKTCSKSKLIRLYWRVALLLESRKVNLKKGFVCMYVCMLLLYSSVERCDPSASFIQKTQPVFYV